MNASSPGDPTARVRHAVSKESEKPTAPVMLETRRTALTRTVGHINLSNMSVEQRSSSPSDPTARVRQGARVCLKVKEMGQLVLPPRAPAVRLVLYLPAHRAPTRTALLNYYKNYILKISVTADFQSQRSGKAGTRTPRVINHQIFYNTAFIQGRAQSEQQPKSVNARTQIQIQRTNISASQFS